MSQRRYCEHTVSVSGVSILLVLLTGLCAALSSFALGFAVYRSGIMQASRILLWIGALSPLAYSAAQTTQTLASGNISKLEIARGILPAVCLMLARLLTRPERRRLGGSEWILVAYLFLALISTAWSISPKQTFLKAVVQVLGVLCVWNLVRRYSSPKAAIHGLATFIHVTLLAVGVEAVAVHRRAFTGGRLSGVFPDIAPDVLGTLAVVGILALVLRQGVGAASGPALRYLLGAIYAAEIIATTTRSALIYGVIVVIAAMLLRSRQSKAMFVALVLLVPLVLLSLTFAAPTFQSFLHRGEDTRTYSTLNGRTVEWSEGIAAWKASPIEGLGYYSGHRFGLTLQPGQIEPSNLDSTWIETLVDLGALGCVVLAAFVIAATTRILRSRDLFDHRTLIFVWSIGLMYLLTSFVNPTIESNNTISFVVWGFVLLAIPTRSGLRRARRPVAVTADNFGDGIDVRSHSLQIGPL